MSASAIDAAFAPHAGDLFTGRSDYARVWRAACEAMGKALDIGLLAEAFGSTPPNAGMFALARRLKTGYAVGIITDNSRDRVDPLRKHRGLDALFDPIVVSAEVGRRKRGKEIFLHARARADAVPGENVFIDNSGANLVVARALGMHAAFHDDGKNDVVSLAKALGRLRCPRRRPLSRRPWPAVETGNVQAPPPASKPRMPACAGFAGKE